MNDHAPVVVDGVRTAHALDLRPDHVELGWRVGRAHRHRADVAGAAHRHVLDLHPMGVVRRALAQRLQGLLIGRQRHPWAALWRCGATDSHLPPTEDGLGHQGDPNEGDQVAKGDHQTERKRDDRAEWGDEVFGGSQMARTGQLDGAHFRLGHGAGGDHGVGRDRSSAVDQHGDEVHGQADGDEHHASDASVHPGHVHEGGDRGQAKNEREHPGPAERIGDHLDDDRTDRHLPRGGSPLEKVSNVAAADQPDADAQEDGEQHGQQCQERRHGGQR